MALKDDIAQELSIFNGYGDWINWDEAMKLAYYEFADKVISHIKSMINAGLSENPFYTDSAHKAYIQALQGLIDRLG